MFDMPIHYGLPWRFLQKRSDRSLWCNKNIYIWGFASGLVHSTELLKLLQFPEWLKCLVIHIESLSLITEFMLMKLLLFFYYSFIFGQNIGLFIATQAFSSCSEQRLLFVAMRRPWLFLFAEHGLQDTWASREHWLPGWCCGTRT